jgi:hypothetical protein
MTPIQHHNKAKEFFLYLGSAIALYGSAISLLNLLFNVINARFPDALAYGVDPYSSSLRIAIATLVILFPLYLVIVHYLNVDLARNPEKKNLGIRKWLIYLALFFASVAIVTDLVVLINTFLGGEITIRFIWKVLAVLVVAAGVFGYYFYDLRSVWQEKRKNAKIISIAASLFVALSIVFAFTVVGSPMTQRLIRIDDQKASDLAQIQSQVVNYWLQKGKLPETLESLNDPISGFAAPTDPESSLGKTYMYDMQETTSFELCADFNLPSSTKNAAALYPGSPSRGIDDNWQHGAGHVCFTRTIDPELYPIIKK